MFVYCAARIFCVLLCLFSPKHTVGRAKYSDKSQYRDTTVALWKTSEKLHTQFLKKFLYYFFFFQTVCFLQLPQQVPQFAWCPDEGTMLVKDECPVSFMLLCTSRYDLK